ncbi:MAG: glutamine amidotransferase-related protein [Waltera sp.]
MIKNLQGIQRYYFVHSYHALCDSKDNILMTCDYGYEFAAAVVKDNIMGVQFHPEKSHDFGMALLNNFVKEC